MLLTYAVHVCKQVSHILQEGVVWHMDYLKVADLVATCTVEFDSMLATCHLPILSMHAHW